MYRRRDWLRVAVLTLAACAAIPAAAAAQSAPKPTGAGPLAELAFLVGTWTGEGGGQPGQTTGTFSFHWEAEQHALLRRNEANVAAGQHEDVLLAFADRGRLRATYVDNEGHVIDYVAVVDTARKRVTFESSGPGPRFRLWYELQKDGSLATAFEMAAPGASEFTTYLEGKARRR